MPLPNTPNSKPATVCKPLTPPTNSKTVAVPPSMVNSKPATVQLSTMNSRPFILPRPVTNSKPATLPPPMASTKQVTVPLPDHESSKSDMMPPPTVNSKPATIPPTVANSKQDNHMLLHESSRSTIPPLTSSKPATIPPICTAANSKQGTAPLLTVSKPATIPLPNTNSKRPGTKPSVRSLHYVTGKPSSHASSTCETAVSDDYRKKYKSLLELEQKEHRRKLAENCNGECTLELCDLKIKPVPPLKFVTYACIRGLQDYQIAYATQAAEMEKKIGAKIYKRDDARVHCRAHILQINFEPDAEQKLYIAFDEDCIWFFQEYFEPEIRKNKFVNVDIEFQLKYSYFKNLQKSVENLPTEVIPRIVPCNRQIFSSSLDVPTVQTSNQMNLDSKQQMALNAILAPVCRNSPPILISGPFGTGKTRIMALAACTLFQRASSAYILVCTQQRESADNFMLMYREVVSKSGSDDFNVTNIILRDYGHRRKELTRFYYKPEDLSNDLLASNDNVLVVTTCLTVHHLVHKNIDFTHIFVDEGAQMREPEAVAALRMANKMTTLVIAGDPQQVGPAMLVFGEEARKGGLDKSLLERLVLKYKELDGTFPVSQNYHVTLVTNYRCHDDIRNLSASLFYCDTPLKQPPKPSDRPGAFKFHESQSSIHFVCSSIKDDKLQNSELDEAEAMAVVKLLVEILQSWPRYGRIKASHFDPQRVCVMSKSRSQLRTIRSLISKQRVSKELQRVRFIPTYAMQGNEYCVLILSTWERLNPDGSPIIDSSKSLCNPHVFNTAITRAESLVVAVGNPYSLLKTEKHMILEDPNYKEKGKCWSNFLKYCIENDTVTLSKSLEYSQQDEVYLSKVKEVVGDHLDKPIKCIPPNKRSHVMICLEDNYTVEYKLGDGSYGIVLQVKRKKTDNRTYTIKLKVCTKDEKRTLEEAEKLCELHHNNIVRYYDSGYAKLPDWEEWKEWLKKKSRFGQSFSSSSSAQKDWCPEPLCFFILTEVCDGGTLRDWLRKNKAKEDRSRSVIRDFLEQILQALKYIHEQNLAHRDLKPSNIFFKSGGTLKVGDFGFVKDMDDHCATEQTVTLPSEDKSPSKNYGTEHYRSPEGLRHPKDRIDWYKVDIYAVGVIFFELCWSFEDREREKIMKKLLPIEESQKPNLPEKFIEEHCNEAADLVLSMTAYNHTQRPCAKSILEGKLPAFTRKLKMHLRKKLSKQQKTKSSSMS